MSFISKNIEVGMVDLKQDLPSLSMNELLFLLDIIRVHKFEGKDLEKIYVLTLKLQKMYITLDKIENRKTKQKNKK